MNWDSTLTGQIHETNVGYGDGNAPWEVLQNIGIRNKAEVARILDIAENPKSLLQSKHDKDERGNPLVSHPLTQYHPWTESKWLFPQAIPNNP